MHNMVRKAYELQKALSVLVSIPYFETSAVSGVNVERAVTTLLDLVMKRMEHSSYGSRTPETNGGHEIEEASARSRCAC